MVCPITQGDHNNHVGNVQAGVYEWLMSAVMSTYMGTRTVVTTVHSNSDYFEVKVGMHQG